MYQLRFHSDVYKDFELIGVSDPIAMARFHAFFAEVKDNPTLLLSRSEGLSKSGLTFSEIIDLRPWNSMRKSGRNLWRLRFSDFAYRDPDYRIIYFVSETLKKIIIIAILKREEIDYDNHDNPICRRISDAYDQYFS